MSTLTPHDSQSIHTTRSVASSARTHRLIKRVIASNDLKPSDLLIERFQIWKSVCNSLIVLFKGISLIEQNTSDELQRLGNAVHEVLPLRTNLFMAEGGLQDILYGIRDNTQVVAQEHDALAKTVNSSIVLHLQKLKNEVKLHIRNIMQDTGKIATLVAAEREASTRLITSLARSLALSQHTPLTLDSRQDPWLCNQIVLEQLHKQVHEENMLQKSILIMQTNSAQFEEALVRAIQTVWLIYQEYNNRKSVEVLNRWSDSVNLFGSILPTTEWLAFSARKNCLLHPDTPLRDHQKITYPGDNHPNTTSIHQGILQRKTRFTKSYKEGYFVLTPAGFLHEFKSSDVSKTSIPELSIFLFDCTLGPPSHAQARTHKFNLTLGKKNTFNREQAYTFRAKSHQDLMEWWNELKEVCKVYLISSIPQNRSGAVPAAVLTLGYGPAIEEEGAGSEVEVDDVPGEVEHRSGSSIEDESSSDNERYGSPMSEITGSAELEAYSSGVTPLSESPKFKLQSSPKGSIATSLSKSERDDPKPEPLAKKASTIGNNPTVILP